MKAIKIKNKTIVVDTLNSGLGIAAKSRADFDSNIKVIPALEFSSKSKLIRELVKSNSSSILFSWRSILVELMAEPKCATKLQKLAEGTSIGVLIPDHIGENGSFSILETKLIQHIDFYLVTSLELYHKYASDVRYPKPNGILHDLPNIRLIQVIRNVSNTGRRAKIIWIGNSKWGVRQGYSDHKGFDKLVLPIFNLLRREFPEIELKIIDSAAQYRSNESVLQELKESCILIQTSKSEGSGLPVLEAMGLGVIPISTKVGIATEIMTNNFSDNLVSQEIDEFMSAIRRNIATAHSKADIAISDFDLYVQKCKNEIIPSIKKPFSMKYTPKKSITRNINSSVLWKLRYLKHKINLGR